MRRPLLFVLASTLLVLGIAPAASQQPPPTLRPQVLVLWIDGTTLGDWAAPGLETFATLLSDGAIASLSAPIPARAVPARRAYAARAVGAGRLPGDGRVASTLPEEPPLTTLGAAIAGAGRSAALISGTRSDEPIGPTPAAALGLRSFHEAHLRDEAFPTGGRTDVEAVVATLDEVADSHLVIVDFADVARVESVLGHDPAARARWVRLSMRRADRVLAAMRRLVDPGDRLMVVSPMPPLARPREAIGAIAVAGSEARSGVLRTRSTQLDGFISIIDVGPTIVDGLGLPPEGPGRAVLASYGATDARPLAGAAATTAREPAAVGHVRALQRDLREAAAARPLLTRTMLVVAMVFVALAFLTIASGRGAPARRGRVPRGWRDALATAAIAVVAFPLLVFVEPILPGRSPGASLIVVTLGVVLVGVGARVALGRERGLLAVLLVSAIVPLLDITAGARLAARSPLVFPLITGEQLRAIDANVLGVVLGAALVGGALLLDRVREPATVAWLPVASGAWIVWAFATAGMGADAGAAVAVVPSILMLVAAALSLRLDARVTVAIVTLTIFALGAVALTYGPAIWVENSPLVPLDVVPDLARARLDLLRDVPALWPLALVLLFAPAGALVVRRRQLVDRGLWGRPALRHALGGSALAAGLAIVAVRAGVVTATIVVLVAAVSTFALLLAADR